VLADLRQEYRDKYEDPVTSVENVAQSRAVLIAIRRIESKVNSHISDGPKKMEELAKLEKEGK
jgi:hypothetical protein